MGRYILGNIRIFCDSLGASESQTTEKKGWGAERNMADWCNYLAFDIMGDLCFGKAFGMLERPDNRFAIELIGNAAHRHLIVSSPIYAKIDGRSDPNKVRDTSIDSQAPLGQDTFPQNSHWP